MRTVAAKYITTNARMWRLEFYGFIGCGIGVVAAGFRWVIPERILYEVIINLFLVVPIALLPMLVFYTRVPWRKAAPWLVCEVASTYLLFALARSVVLRDGPGDFIGVMLVCFPIACVASLSLLVIWQQFRRPIIGPYCPACRYCLIGAREDVCPECGRSFTLKELHISREALNPKGAV